MEKKIDCRYTDEIVCPHCGYKFSDSSEVFDLIYNDLFEGLECDGCGKEFDVERYISITYISYKKPKEK